MLNKLGSIASILGLPVGVAGLLFSAIGDVSTASLQILLCVIFSLIAFVGLGMFWWEYRKAGDYVSQEDVDRARRELVKHFLLGIGSLLLVNVVVFLWVLLSKALIQP